MTADPRPLVIVTGASAGIGYELATCCAEQGFDVLIAADQPTIHHAAQDFRALGAAVAPRLRCKPENKEVGDGKARDAHRHDRWGVGAERGACAVC
jgi:NAD(P)-dependent dehydrogenase (short-subunit alcohol dehydrogenase family)